MTTTGKRFELVVLDGEGEVEDILTEPATWARTERERDAILARDPDEGADPDYFPTLMIRPYED